MVMKADRTDGGESIGPLFDNATGGSSDCGASVVFSKDLDTMTSTKIGVGAG